MVEAGFVIVELFDFGKMEMEGHRDTDGEDSRVAWKKVEVRVSHGQAFQSLSFASGKKLIVMSSQTGLRVTGQSLPRWRGMLRQMTSL